MRNVTLTINATQFIDDDNRDTFELITDGKYSYEKGLGVLKYSESAITGMEGTETTISASPTRVVLTREGTINTTMPFEQGHKQICVYETPMGAMTINIATLKAKTGLGKNGGSLELEYTLGQNGDMAGRNSISIRVTPSVR
ncbi:MAG: DUF1934 domain-containing protein [Oscillospiraceae bacterium]|jgi:uncharacterized beta-barrel protein YwiB (DUF1934 family)|nr:DUF1934 domain-containing protein [Oscillospiraceae bacterium]